MNKGKIAEPASPPADAVRELQRCVISVWHFITAHVHTLERKTGVRKFPDWPYLRRFVETVHAERLAIVLKSRQMLASWTVSAYLLWHALFNGECDHLILSKRSDEAEEMLVRVRFMFHHLPDWMKVSVGVNNKNILEFRGSNSRIISLPATPDVGRAYAPGVVFWDEMAFTPYDEEIFASLQPALDGGGKFIGVSSANGSWTKHGRLWINADEAGFARVRIHYSEHPEKDGAWEREARKGISGVQWAREQEMSLEAGGMLVYDSFTEETHVTDFRFTPGLPVYRAVDFGYHTPVVLWIQVAGDDTAVVCREWIGTNCTISATAEALREGDRELGITEADVVCTYCDPAGAAKNDSGISSVEILAREGVNLEYRASSIAAGVDLVREKLMDAAGRTALFVSRSCKRVINDFRRYRRHPQTGEPVKDGVSDHAMDALRYFVINYYRLDEDNLRAGLGARVAGINRYGRALNGN